METMKSETIMSIEDETIIAASPFKIPAEMDIVNKIAEVATDYSDKPLEPQIMKTVTVEE